MPDRHGSERVPEPFVKRLLHSRAAQTAAAVLILLTVWQVAALAVGERILLASPLAVLSRLAVIWTEPGFFGAVLFSFIRISGGACLGIAAGILLAVAAGRFRAVEILLRPLMVTVKSVPVASFIVIALIWLSSSLLSVFISFLIVLPVIYSNVLGGIRAVPREMKETARVFHMKKFRQLIYIGLPAVKPYFISACGSALGMAWKAGVAAEVIGLPDGSIGEALYEAKVYFNSTDLLAWTIVIVLVSVGFEKLFMLLLRLLAERIEKL